MSAGGLFTNRVPTPQGVAFRQRQKAVREGARRVVPADLGARAKTMCQEDLARHYSCGRATVRRWLADAGISAAQGVYAKKTPTPADLPEMAARMGRNALALHYGISYNTIVRMLADAGLEAVKTQPAPRPQPTGYRKMPVARKRTHIGANHLVRDASTEGQAADVLRRLAAVYRCTEKGAADPKGGWWRYGSVVLAGAELIERARRHGFDPDAWRTISTRTGASVIAVQNAVKSTRVVDKRHASVAELQMAGA